MVFVLNSTSRALFSFFFFFVGNVGVHGMADPGYSDRWGHELGCRCGGVRCGGACLVGAATEA